MSSSIFFVVVFILVREASGQMDLCVDFLREIDLPVVKTVPQEPLDYWHADDACFYGFGADFTLMYSWTNLTDEERTLCGDSLVPVGILGDVNRISFRCTTCGLEFKMDDYYQLMENNTDNLTEGSAALNLTTGKWHFVNYSDPVSCVLCQKTGFRINPGPPSNFFFKIHIFFEITITSTTQWKDTEGNVSDEERTLLEDLILDALSSNDSTPLQFYNSSLDDDDRLVVVYKYNNAFPGKEFIGLHIDKVVNLGEDFSMAWKDMGYCRGERTMGADGSWFDWPDTERGFYSTAVDFPAGPIPRRTCSFDTATNRVTWSPTTYWEIVWKPCFEETQYPNEQRYAEFLGPQIAYRHQHQLQAYTESRADCAALHQVCWLVNRDIVASNKLNKIMFADLITILSNADLEDDACVANEVRAQLIVANTTVENPVVGFTFSYNDMITMFRGTEPLSVDLDRAKNSTTNQRQNVHFSLAISKDLLDVTESLAFIALWTQAHSTVASFSVSIDDIFSDSESRTQRYKLSIEVTTQLQLLEDTGSLFLNDKDYFVEITFLPWRGEEVNDQLIEMMDIACAAWNNDLGDWVTQGCHKNKALKENRVLCRCSAKYFARKGDMLLGKYALMRESIHNAQRELDFFKDSTSLIVATVLECLLSVMALCSILLTAICFKDWRKNTGHKILLQMVAALTINLVLGFLTNFVILDTESVGCLVIGVVRHYTFLAMFLWMLVLSGLQMKRLTTVAGAKATTHLILKVSIFAWGFPVLPIATLLIWNTRFYQTDRFDRGYCYPDGLVFDLTVQAPAGLILLINFAIFIMILTHIFECRGEKKIKRHSKNQKAEQLNKLKTSLFIFFLFGFTWLFHFLSEERVIVSDFLFEYLFLMTATTHLVVLALFFIVFQESTRTGWLVSLKSAGKNVIARKTVVRKARRTRPPEVQV